MYTDNPYWLFGWIRSKGVKTIDDAARILSEPSERHEMASVAEDYWSAGGARRRSGFDLVAGAGLSLDKPFSCPSFPCRRKQVDKLFRHAWHYFDVVILPDIAGQLLLHQDWNKREKENFANLVSFVATVIYIMGIGAEELVDFSIARPSNTPLEKIREYASRHVTGPLASLVKELESSPGLKTTLLSETEFGYEYSEPDIKITHGANLRVGIGSSEKIAEPSIQRHWAAVDLVIRYLQAYEVDLQVTGIEGGSLGASLAAYKFFSTTNDVSPEQVAFELGLPTLSNIPIKELLSLRSVEGDSFVRFRVALRRAIREAISHGSDSKLIAQEIEREIIAPEISSLRLRLAEAERVLKRKTVLSISLGVLSTTCGLIAGIAPAVAVSAGFGAMVAGVSSSASRYIDQESEIRNSDLFFIWKAVGHAEQRISLPEIGATQV